MHKTSQRMGLLNRIRQTTNLGGQALEFTNERFREVMNKLRDQVDDPIRSIMTGKEIGRLPPGFPTELLSDERSIKQILKSARGLFNSSEYMKSVAEVARFHKKMEYIIKLLLSFQKEVIDVNREFLFQGLDDDTRKYLYEDLKNRFAEHYNADFIKEAGVLDFFLGTPRSRALAAWEKRYSKRLSKFKTETKHLLDRSDDLSNFAIDALKDLAYARATRKIDDYILASDKLIKKYTEYDKLFRDYYNAQIKGFLENPEMTSPKESVKNPGEIGKQNINVPDLETKPTFTPKPTVVPTVEVKSPEVAKKEKIMRDMGVPESVIQKSKLPEEQKQILPPTNLPQIKDPELQKLVTEQPQAIPFVPGTVGPRPLKPPPKKVESHDKFVKSLEKLSNENPLILAKYILKYASIIKESDPNSADKLINIVNSIKV